MVGDTSADIGAAKAAGVSSAAAFWGTQDAADLRKTCPDHYLEAAGEIPPLFGETIIHEARSLSSINTRDFDD